MSMPMTKGSASGAHTEPKGHPLAHLPGDDGWPIVGNTLTVLRDPVGAVEAMHAKHGPVFRSRVFGFRSVSLLGPEANELRSLRP